MTPITAKMMWEFCEDFAKGEYKHQRFGQAFCNAFLPAGVSDPNLFYCESRIQAEKMIDARGYINWSV